MEVEASAGAGVVLGKRDVGRRAGSSLFCGRCPRYFSSPTEHVGKKSVRAQGKCIQVTKTGVALPLILLVLLSHEQLLRAEETKAKSSANVDASILAQKREREVNSS